MVNHADPLDKASEIAQMYSDYGLQTVRSKIKPEQVQNEDGTWPVLDCVDCDEPLPEGRLWLGKVRCVECQGQLERRKNVFGR